MKVNDKVVWLDPENETSCIVNINKILGDVFFCSNEFTEMEVYGNELRELDLALCCSQCGNIDVEERTWSYVNTSTINGNAEIGLEDNWCKECSGHIDIMTVEDYLKQKEDE